MTIECFESYDELSNRAADAIADTVRVNPEAHFCLATGSSPLGAYMEIGRRAARKEVGFADALVTKLDEWIGVPMTHSSTCESFLRQEVLIPWGVAEDRYLSFNTEAIEPVVECARIESALDSLPRFDLSILGIGTNGHLGLNEPSSELKVNAHVASLAESTRHHPMLGVTDLQLGMTLGFGRLMTSRRILLLVVGETKSVAWKRLLEGVITTDLPASLLHCHPDVVCLSTLPF